MLDYLRLRRVPAGARIELRLYAIEEGDPVVPLTEDMAALMNIFSNGYAAPPI